MKTNKYHIFFAWLLLICFAAGQYMVYAHQHRVSSPVTNSAKSAKRSAGGVSIKERCNMCDVMHHNVMLAAADVQLPRVDAAHRIFQGAGYDFKSIQLILAAGRAPPAC